MPTFAFAGGADATVGWGQRSRFRFLNTWVAGDTWSVNVTTNLQGDFTLGMGSFEGATYAYGLIHDDRAFIANGANWNFSAIGDPTGWEQQNVGAGFESFTTSYGIGDAAVGMAITQGRLAVFGRTNIQIWTLNADPALITRVQTIQNAGTFAPGSIQSIGELDVLYLDDTGVRSLRTKETTLNAYVDDVGTPIDANLQPEILEWQNSVIRQLQFGVACSAVEPKYKRYMLYFNGVIFTLSSFPSSKIRAWSTYDRNMPTSFVGSNLYSGGGTVVIGGLTVGVSYLWVPGPNDTSLDYGSGVLTEQGVFTATQTSVTASGTASLDITFYLYENTTSSFLPKQMFAFEGKVWVLDTLGKLIVYGGLDGNTFDPQTIPTADLPWIAFDSPATKKQAMGLHAAIKGAWKVYASANPQATSMTEVISRGSATDPNSLNDSTYDIAHYPYSANGTHIHLKAVGQAAWEPQVLSMLTVLYNDTNKN